MKILHLSDPSHGWIEITFGQAPDTYTLAASHTPNDCLGDLAAATSRLLRVSTDETLEFSLEPGFATCQLHRESDSIRVVVTLPSEGAPVFDDKFPLLAFAHRLRFELLRIEPRYADQNGWNHRFPQHEIDNLV